MSDKPTSVNIAGGQGIQVGEHNVQVNVVAIGQEPDQPATTVFAPGQQLPDEYPPSSLLRGDYEVVRFAGRTTELDQLTAWCEQDKRVAVLLVSGPGGQGKTRLARELCHQREAEGWTTGFLRQDARAEAVVTLTERDTPLLLVMDYAETRAAQITEIGRAVADNTSDRVRLVLLARSAGDWWAKLYDNADERLAALLETAAKVELGPVTRTTAGRRRSFESARDAFAARLEVAALPVTPPPDLDDDRYGLMLTVHMAALALLLDGAEFLNDAGVGEAEPTWRDPARRVLAHERRYWERTRAARGLPEVIGVETLGQVVAVATLFGAPDPAAALRLLKTLPDLADQPQAVIGSCLRWAVAMHPGADALNPLQPDRLGEDHVAAVLHDVPKLIDQALPQAGDHQVRRALTVLGRAASRHKEVGPFLRGFLARDPARLLLAGTEVAAQLRDPVPLADAIAACLPELNDRDATRRLIDALPRETVALADLAVEVTRTAVSTLDVSGENTPQHAALLNDLATRLSATDAHEEALEEAEHAVTMLRQATGDHGVLLATALHTQASAQIRLGMKAEAADAYREAITLCEGVEGAEHLLACSLSSYARFAADVRSLVGRSERAVQILARLAETEPPDRHLDYAMALDNHVSVLTVAGSYQDAMAAAQKAERTLRPLAALRPDGFLPYLGGVLNTIAALHGHLGHSSQGLRPAEEAVGIFRDNAAQKPHRFDLQLIDVLTTYAGVLSELGQGGRAFDVSAEEVAICQRLVVRRPAAHLLDFERAAGNLAAVATRSGRTAEALAILRDAEAQLRQLPPSRPRDDACGVTFTAIGNVLYQVADHAAAVDAGRQAVAALRGGARLDRLAVALAFLAVAQAHAGDPAGAMNSARAAVEAGRSLDPAFELERTNVARALTDMAVPLTELGLYWYAEECTRHAVGLAREAADRNPAWEHDLAMGLYHHAVVLCGQSVLNRHRWLAELDEAIARLQRLARQSAQARADLANARRFREAALSGKVGAQVIAATGAEAASSRRPGRNERCPCGSGLKYKRCCGAPPTAR